LIRTAFLFLLCAAFAGRAFPQEQSQLDGSLPLFTVLAAANVAGYDAEIQSPSNHPFRLQLRQSIEARKLPVVAELKRFFSTHRPYDATAQLSQLISFGLCLEGGPEFRYRYPPDKLPPDVVAMAGLENLLTRFYQEAGIAEYWQQAQPAIEQAIERYHGPASRALLASNAYLRNPTSGLLGRRFQVYLDVLGAPHQVHTRNYLDDYFVVITHSPEVQADYIRHAYLQYLLDGVVNKNAEELNKRRALADYAQGAPALDEAYKEDFLLLATKSLIKAVESRLAPGGQRQTVVHQALREGYILTPHFAEALLGYEKQEEAFRLYFPEMIKQIDMKREERRLANVEFASERAVTVVRTSPRVDPLEKPKQMIEDAELLASQKKLQPARDLFQEVLRSTQDRPLRARSYYGLARIATLENDPDGAEKLFEQALESEPDPGTAAWSHVYLARLADVSGEPEKAREHYQAALAIDGGSAAARKTAEQGLQGAFQRK
jgi:tetratricopeptide (TPR) repeat protein